MNYILSENQYQQLISLAHKKGLDDVERVLLAATPSPTSPEQDTEPSRTALYEDIVAFNATLDQEFPHLKDIDMTAWICEDRENR